MKRTFGQWLRSPFLTAYFEKQVVHFKRKIDESRLSFYLYHCKLSRASEYTPEYLRDLILAVCDFLVLTTPHG